MLALGILATSALFAATSQVGGLDSPARIQRHKQQSWPSPAGSNYALEQSANGEQQAGSPIRVRRTNEPRVRQQQQQQQPAGSRARQAEECPQGRLLNSLLPPEYLGSPALSQRQQRAYCDCTADLFGWHLTCFAGSAAALEERQALASAANSRNQALPNQLHPAFRAPQLQRQQQQQQQQAAAAANLVRRIQRRSPARWMGDEPTDAARNLTNPENDAEDSSSHPISLANHEGFGEELTTLAPPPTTTTATSSSSIKLAPSSRHSKRKSPKRVSPPQSFNESNIDDSFISMPSSASFTLMQLQRQDQGERSAKLLQSSSSANNNPNLMFQTVPVLFSVKYLRNNMIEIDCDQAAPNYKPAMFQGKWKLDNSSFFSLFCAPPLASSSSSDESG